MSLTGIPPRIQRDVLLIARMKELGAENARLRKMVVEEKIKSDSVWQRLEYLSTAITECARQYGIRLDSIQPGKSQHNAYVERFNRSVRYKWLSLYHWKDVDHVQRFATDWM